VRRPSTDDDEQLRLRGCWWSGRRHHGSWREQETLAVGGHGRQRPRDDRHQPVDGVPAVAPTAVHITPLAPEQLHNGRGRPQVTGQRPG